MQYLAVWKFKGLQSPSREREGFRSEGSIELRYLKILFVSGRSNQLGKGMTWWNVYSNARMPKCFPRHRTPGPRNYHIEYRVGETKIDRCEAKKYFRWVRKKKLFTAKKFLDLDLQRAIFFMKNWKCLYVAFGQNRLCEHSVNPIVIFIYYYFFSVVAITVFYYQQKFLPVYLSVMLRKNISLMQHIVSSNVHILVPSNERAGKYLVRISGLLTRLKGPRSWDTLICTHQVKFQPCFKM